MHVFVVYAHPSEDSFTRHARDRFIEGLKAAGHSYEISDLYKMGFQSDLTEAEYRREAFYTGEGEIGEDVKAEQEKIQRSDAIAFIYPVFWTEAPAKLVGWFDRVWTYGFAYGNQTMKTLEKALCICTAGSPREKLVEGGFIESMNTVMLGDRIYNRARAKEMIVLDGTSRSHPGLRAANWDKHLETVYHLAFEL